MIIQDQDIKHVTGHVGSGNMKIIDLDEGLWDKLFGPKKEKTLADDPHYKGWLKIYKSSPDAASIHKDNKKFLKYYLANRGKSI